MSYYNWLRRTHKKVEEPDPPAAPTWEFELGTHLYRANTQSPQLLYTNIDKGRGNANFGTYADPTKATVNYPTLNSTDRYPTEDCGWVFPTIPYSASAQTMHCRLLGTATISVTPSSTWTISNTQVIGSGADVTTTFDINIAAGANEGLNGCLKFLNTRRDSTGAANTGIRGLIIRSPGIELDDPAIMMPYMAAALEPFAFIRYQQPMHGWTDLYSRGADDRPTPTRKGFMPGNQSNQTIAMEDLIAASNELGKSMWLCIPVGVEDDYIEEIAQLVYDNLDPSLWAIFELSNEIWNVSVPTAGWAINKAMREVNGWVWQYCQGHFVSFLTKTAGTVTAEFELPDGHGCVPGDVAYVTSLNGITTGYKTILTTPSATVCTWLESPAGTDFARRADDGQFRSERLIVSAVKAGTVCTVTFGSAHGLSPGTEVRCNGMAPLLTTKVPIASVPSATTITLPIVAGQDGPITLGGASSLVAGFTSVLNSFDSAHDQHLLARRWYANRTKEMSDIVAGIFGGTFGSRAKICLMNQPTVANDLSDQVSMLTVNYGPLKNYIHGIGKGSYAQLNAEGFPGGVNLRNLTTYNGNTPPAIADYAATWAITGTHIKDGVGPNTGGYDSVAATARLHDVELWCYEWGPDATASSNAGEIANPPGTTEGTDAGRQKIDTLHDVAFSTAYENHLDTLESSYFRKAAVYHSGQCAVGNSSATQSWGIYRDFTDPTASVRFNACVDRNEAARTGPTRNLLDQVSPTTIDGRAYANNYEYSGYSGSFPSVCVGNPPQQTWLISCTENGDFEFEPTFNSSSGTRNIIVQVNGVALPNYSIPPGDTTFSPVTLSLTKGHNVIRTVPGTANPGVTVTCKSFLFTPV
jgi:hypothetical protein